MEMEEELIQYYIVNEDLNMSSGKTAAQVAHASMLIALRDQLDVTFQLWLNSIMKKIVLRGHLKDLEKVYDSMPTNTAIKIIDKGLTEIPPDSVTVIGFPVMTRKEAKQYIKRLQLL